MKTNSLLRICIVIVLLPFSLRAQSSSSSSQIPIGEILHSDGTVNLETGFESSLDLKEYGMKLGKNGEPVFLPESQLAENLQIVIDGDADPGEDFYIDIYANDVNNLFGLSFEMVYNPGTFVDPLSVEEGADNFLGSDLIFFPNIDKTQRKVGVGMSRKSGSGGVSGSGRVVRIKCHMSESAVVGQSSTLLSFQNITANDAAGSPISFTGSDYTLLTGGTSGPTADFTAAPTSGPAPLTVQFTNQSTGDITSYLWDFGDGNTSTAVHPSHTYQSDGTYTVKLTVTGSGGSHTKTRTNYISVISDESDNMLVNGNFSAGTSPWYLWHDPSASASGAVQNGEYTVSITNGGSTSNQVQLVQLDLLIENGCTYDVSYDAYADASREIIPFMSMNDSPWTIYSGYQPVNLSTTKKKYTYSFTMNHTTDADGKILFDLGNSNTDVTFDNVVLTKRKPSNMLFNGEFSHGVGGWDFYVISPAVAACSVENGEYHIAITNGGVNGWDVHLQQQNLLIENGATYTFSFDAWAASPRQIIPFVAMSEDPWTIYGYRELMITTAKQTYSYSFTMNQATNTDARVVFDVGTSTVDVYLDNIALTKEQTPVKERENDPLIPETCELSQNYPNPFNPETTIEFKVAERSLVTLKIYNVHGQLIEILTNDVYSAGTYEATWNAEGYPSGIYLCRFENNKTIETRKLILQK